MKKGETTRLRVLDEAAHLAAKRGLNAISLADVADAVGLSKSGLFKHFESKDAMQAEIVGLVLERFDAFIYGAALALPAGRPRVQMIFDRWLEWGEACWPTSGCPLNTFSIELDDQPGPLRDAFQSGLMAFRHKVIAEFQVLREPPLPRPEAEAAYFQMKSFILGQAEARRMLGDADARAAAAAAFHALLDRTSKVAA